MNPDGRSVVLRDAATLLLLRQGACGPEVLMVKRHPGNAFVPDCYVFPGGAVDSSVARAAAAGQCRGLDGRTAHSLLPDLPSPEAALASWIAAVRETFEETGLLLACDKENRMVEMAGDAAKSLWAGHRRSLRNQTDSFQNLLAKENLYPACGVLRYLSRWITPLGLPIRYDVRFFVAPAPMEQEASHDRRELTEHVWIQPRHALNRCSQGTFDMVLPTIRTLQEIACFATVEEVLARAEHRRVTPVLTKIRIRGGAYVEVMPDEENP